MQKNINGKTFSSLVWEIMEILDWKDKGKFPDNKDKEGQYYDRAKEIAWVLIERIEIDKKDIKVLSKILKP